GGTAVVAENGDIQFPHPFFYQGGIDADLMDVMYVTLTRSEWRDGRLGFMLSDRSPMAAAWHYEYVGADSAALRYRMKSGLKWSDGRPITAQDVVWTYGMYADTTLASPRQENVADVDSVVAENDTTVVFYFKRRYPEMIFDSGLHIVPQHAYRGTAPSGLRTHPVFSKPETMVVSGPFKIGAWQPGQQVTLVPNPNGPVQPRLDRIVIRVIPEPTTRIVEMRNGSVDFARGIGFDQIAALRQQDPTLHFDREQGRFWEFVAYNPQKVPQFADPDIRRALGMAVDVQAIIRQLRMEEYTVPASGPYPPIFKDVYDPQRMRPLAPDTAQARRILEAKGWRDTDGDGIREKDGRPFRFTLITNTGNQRRADVSQILQQAWRNIGVDLRLQGYELGTYQGKMISERDYEAALGSWGVELSPNLTAMWAPEAAFNITGYSHPEVTRLLDEAERQPTAALANPLWKAAAERIVQDQPYTWLYYYDAVTGRRDRLRGVKVDTYGAYQNTWEWWVTDATGRRGAGAADSAGSQTKG
ncbi:MAG TPA: ABC transporter substrate-binding protein, partial [Longimicrobium sp.]|nr:ABC transporter substrate-binding protein [Longimicrobium sp.]